MKYDQHLLESAYKKVYLKEEISSFNDGEYDPLPNPPQEPDSESEITREIDEEDDRAEVNDSVQEIINKLGDRVNTEPLLEKLNGLNSNEIDELISNLNDGEQWGLKDNLIRFLFMLRGYEFKTNSLG